MGITGIKIKIMPMSPEIDLEEIKNKVKSLVEKNEGINREYIEEPVAFGLKAIIAFFEYPEEKSPDEIEEQIKKIENINSTQIIDMRKIA